MATTCFVVEVDEATQLSNHLESHGMRLFLELRERMFRLVLAGHLSFAKSTAAGALTPS